MTDQDILVRIRDLVRQEHELRSGTGGGETGSPAERARLADLEVQLDQCWDLLRQRRARMDAGQDPEQAQANTAKQVEGYLQ
ncbi:MAG: DUF2630 family protein [Nocardia sp.]|nr:DUF2630 family protein [Nocardia sp.]